MSKFKDLSGMTFGYWKVLYCVSKGTNIKAKYHCICTLCNKEYDISGYSLTSGRSTKCRSCGTKIGKTKEFSGDQIKIVFKGMKQRCYNPNTDSFKNYGAKGIVICDEWIQNPNEFYKWAYENGYGPKMSIERKDITKGYSPENCTFIPLDDQSKNRSVNYMISLNNKTQCLADWCTELNLNYTTAQNRAWRHMTVDEILFLPLNYHRLKALDAISFVPEESREGFDYIKDFEERQRRF